MRRMRHAIATFEALKGLAAFAAVVGALDLMHHDVRHLAIELIGRFHLNPEAHYPSVLLHYANLIPDANLHALFLLAAGYIAVRLVESYGLWNDYAWGEWLGALSGGIYIPFEVNHLLHRPSLINGLVLVGNMFLVAFLTVQLWRRHDLINH
ncbi:tmRNA [Noviherbaspirillum autotrophicum]|uniref:TmRNA n=2 Tax=Noviherbaspirillum autotrophicum TaxID=709839 RepID=A0A0C2BNK6_9BURK|nr:tmRNA [Noviherbaspirillum autotrophicum]